LKSFFSLVSNSSRAPFSPPSKEDSTFLSRSANIVFTSVLVLS
jgi:hypothetical protein